MSDTDNYEKINQPYNSLLQRVPETSSQSTPRAVGEPNSTNYTQEYDGGFGYSGENGNVQQMPVRDDGGIGDLWIKTFIKSVNWKPKKVGFYIDGGTGYAEFTNVFVSGNIEALTGSIGGFEIGSDYVRDEADSFGLSSTVTVGDDVRFWAGSTFDNRATAPFRVLESGIIVAESGTVGGFTLGTDYIRDTADSFGFASTVTLGDDIRFWAGSTFDNRDTAPFRVSEAGVVVASSGTIGGWSLTTTTFQDSTGRVKMDSTNARFLISDGTNDRVLLGYLLNGF